MVALDLSRVSDIEYSALQALIQGEKRNREQGTTVWMVGMNPGVLEIVRNAGLDKQVGPERMLFDVRAAIKQFQALQASGGLTEPPVS